MEIKNYYNNVKKTLYVSFLLIKTSLIFFQKQFRDYQKILIK